MAPSGKLADALANAVVLGDSRGTPEQAAKILDGAIGKYAADSGVREVVAALAYLAELNVRTGDTGRARSSIARIRAIELTDAERADVADELLAIDDIDRDLQKTWARTVSNRRPPGCKPGALPLSYAPEKTANATGGSAQPSISLGSAATGQPNRLRHGVP